MSSAIDGVRVAFYVLKAGVVLKKRLLMNWRLCYAEYEISSGWIVCFVMSNNGFVL